MGTSTAFDSTLIRFSNVRTPRVDTSLAPINTRAGIRKIIVITFFISPSKPREQKIELQPREIRAKSGPKFSY
jgi:hypothetical protein